MYREGGDHGSLGLSFLLCEEGGFGALTETEAEPGPRGLAGAGLEQGATDPGGKGPRSGLGGSGAATPELRLVKRNEMLLN